jgi:7-cyano-7-deazaguanine synthase in queuosine biosynthesis
MVVYLAFTGGVDSTYVLLHLLIRQQVVVQPVYLGGQIDGLSNPRISREKSELAQIDILYQSLQQFLTKAQLQRLLPIQVKHLTLHPEVKTISEFLFQAGFLRRPVTQFSYLLSLTKHLGRNILVGNLRTDRLLYDCPYLDNTNKCLQLPYTIDPRRVCRKIKFPLCHYGKSEILFFIQRYDWNHLIKQTKSCWYHRGNQLHSQCVQCRYILNYQRHFRLKNELHQEMRNWRNKHDE